MRARAELEREEDPDSPGDKTGGDEGGFRCGGGLPIRLMRLSLTNRSSSFPLILGLFPRPDDTGEEDGEWYRRLDGKGEPSLNFEDMLLGDEMVKPPKEATGVEVIRLRVPPAGLGLTAVDDPGLEGEDSLGIRNSGKSGVSSIVNRPLA